MSLTRVLGNATMKRLDEVQSFGGIDADADSLLDACFQDHEAYQRVRNHENFLVVGRKGSGKTAIFKRLVMEHVYDHFTFGHTFSDYPWHHHDAQALGGVPDEERYSHSWKYLILMAAAKILLNHDASQPWNVDCVDALSRLESFVVDSYGSRDPDVNQFFTPEKRLRINPTFGIPGTHLSAGISLERLPVRDLPLIVQDFNRSVCAAVIQCLNPDHSYHICFDQLDLGFDPLDPKYAQRLTGLILAARDLTTKASAQNKRFSVVIFLRDDIYQSLQFEDKNKVSENQMVRIEWDSPRTQWTLKDVMEKRFAEVLEISQGGAWAAVFDEDQEMRGRQTKYQHILGRTFRRPRDIIKFCNEVLSCFKERKGGRRDRFQNEDVIEARQAYSEYLLNELDDEIFKHEPQYKEYMELLKHIGTLQFNRDVFREVFSARTDLFSEQASATAALSGLFEFSIIGYLKTGGGRGGSGYAWRYLDPRARFDASATNFRVHPGFKEVLDLKEGVSES